MTGYMVTVVAPEMSQLKIAESPGLIVSGVAMNELMPGGKEVGETLVSPVSSRKADEGVNSSGVSRA